MKLKLPDKISFSKKCVCDWDLILVRLFKRLFKGKGAGK
jgi:hypothetical protein